MGRRLSAPAVCLLRFALVINLVLGAVYMCGFAADCVNDLADALFGQLQRKELLDVAWPVPLSV
jgi:hypothetical protein